MDRVGFEGWLRGRKLVADYQVAHYSRRMSVLVDSSVWIDYFRGTGEELHYLIEEALVVTNELILAELVPSLHMRRQRQLLADVAEPARSC